MARRVLLVVGKKQGSTQVPTRAPEEQKMSEARIAEAERTTRETKIYAQVSLDGSGQVDVDTGLGFLDHMLEQLGVHGLFDMKVRAAGDLHIDGHHTVEDTGVVIGEALGRALEGGKGVRRFACAYVPMDEALVRVVVDVSGRGFLQWDVTFARERIGDMDTELVEEWFRAFARTSGITVHVQALYGKNAHHCAEACFKGLAYALRDAVAIDARRGKDIPSTKGVLEVAS